MNEHRKKLSKNEIKKVKTKRTVIRLEHSFIIYEDNIKINLLSIKVNHDKKLSFC